MTQSVITVEQLQNASLDAQALETFISGSDAEQVITRLSQEYPTLAKALKILMETGGWQFYPTESELKATVPNVVPSVAYAADTKKLYQYVIGSDNVGVWRDEGLSALDLARQDIKFDSTVKQLLSQIEQYAHAISDSENNIAWAVNWAGNVQHGQVMTELSNYAKGVIDSDDRVAFLIKENGDIYIPSLEVGSLKGQDDVKTVVSCYEENGNIFKVSGGAIQQITTDGLSRSPTIYQDSLIFLNKCQGTYKQYIFKDGAIKRYHPNDVLLNFKHVILTGQSLAWGPDAIIDGKRVDGQQCLGAERVFAYQESLGDPQVLQDKQNETIATGFASSLIQDNEKILFSGCARGGRAYNAIKKNGTENIYANCLANIVRARSEYDQNTYVPAVLLVHGEQDGVEGRSDYAACLKQLIDDYNFDIQAQTGQPSSAVLITCQTSSASGYRDLDKRDSFQTPFAQVEASNTYADVFLVGPKYQYDYIDHAHYNRYGTRHHGEMMAKVYKKVVVDGENWKPLQPINFTVQGNQIIIDFHVPTAPLQFDTTWITAVANKGFELKATDCSITDVALTSNTQVTLTCSNPIPQGAIVSYAFYNGTYQKSGRTEGSRGLLKDSDNTADLHGYMPLNNWCVTFKKEL